MVDKPGLYFKCPLMHNMRYFDTRILTIDSAEPERFLTREKERAGGSLRQVAHLGRAAVLRQRPGRRVRAQTRLLQTINDGLRAEFGKRTVHEVVSGERERSWSSCARRPTRTRSESA